MFAEWGAEHKTTISPSSMAWAAGSEEKFVIHIVDEW